MKIDRDLIPRAEKSNHKCQTQAQEQKHEPTHKSDFLTQSNRIPYEKFEIRRERDTSMRVTFQK